MSAVTPRSIRVNTLGVAACLALVAVARGEHDETTATAVKTTFTVS